MAGALHFAGKDQLRSLWDNPEFLAERNHTTLLRRIGDPLDVAGVAMFPASPASAFMTGQVLVIDGGVTV